MESFPTPRKRYKIKTISVTPDLYYYRQTYPGSLIHNISSEEEFLFTPQDKMYAEEAVREITQFAVCV